MEGFKVVNVRTLIDGLGEDAAKNILSAFLCPLNLDVQDFLRLKAIDFMKQGWAQTHLVFASYKKEPVLVGYFSLANKFITVSAKAVKGETRKKLAKHATYDDCLKSYQLAIPLIAQLGKNFIMGYNKLITGDELMGIACNKIKAIQYDLGGRFAYLECEDKPKLIEFYERHGFREFDRRPIDSDETGIHGDCLVQMIRMFKGNEYT